MSINWDGQDYASYQHAEALFSNAVEHSLKMLLEQKHLYQRTTIEWPGGDELLAYDSKTRPANSSVDLKPYWNKLSKDAEKLPWGIQPISGHPSQRPTTVSIHPRTIRVYCQICEEPTPFNFQGGSDFYEYSERDQQIFHLRYQCQGCKSLPEIFMIQRNGLKIWQAGRAPMEKVLVPKFIPKAVEKYYSGALIAYHSGQVLPAKFMLRVLIEQYVRQAAPNPKTRDIESLFDAYKKDLPEVFNQQAPSLETIYDDLSDDIHAANETTELFEQVRKDIDLHFEAKELFARFPKK